VPALSLRWSCDLANEMGGDPQKRRRSINAQLPRPQTSFSSLIGPPLSSAAPSPVRPIVEASEREKPTLPQAEDRNERNVQPAIPPFKIFPFCFNDRCRLDNQLPEPFALDNRLGRWMMGLGLDKVSGKVLEEEGEEGEDFR